MASNWGAFLFHAIAGYLVAPFVVANLGDQVYGVWALLGSTVGYLGLLDLGVRGAVTKFVANLHASDDHAAAESYASTALAIFVVTAVVAALGGVLIAAILGVFNIPVTLLPAAQTAVILSALSISVAFIAGVYGGIITARERFDLSSGLDVLLEGVRIAAVVLALSAGHGLVALAMIQLGVGLLRLGASYLVSRRLYPELRPTLGKARGAQLRDIFGFSVATTGLRGASVLILQMDTIVIATFMPVASITPFAIASSLAGYARQTVGAISQTITPRVSALQGNTKGSEDIWSVPLAAARVATLLLLPIVITFLIRGKTFIGLWMGPQYAGPAGEVLVILSIPLYVGAARQVMASALMGLNRHMVLVPVYLLEGALNLGISIALVGSLGIAGVAWGTTIPAILTTAFVLPKLYSQELGVPFIRFWVDAWVRPAGAMLPFAAGTMFLESITSPASQLVFFSQVAAMLPLAVLGAWQFGLAADERRRASELWWRLRRE